jgi:hypothetical protein
VLAKYVGKLVECEGVYWHTTPTSGYVRTHTLLQNVVVKTHDGEYEIGHVYVQESDEMAKFQKRDSLSFEAFVHSYHHTESGEVTYGLKRPRNVTNLDPDYSSPIKPVRQLPVPIPVPVPAAQSAPPDPRVELNALASLVNLKKTIGEETPKSLLPHLGELATTLEKTGGPDRMKELAEVLLG